MKNNVLIGSFILVSSLILSACQNQNNIHIKGEETGIHYYKNGQYDKAFSTLKELADTGNVNAAFYIGKMFHKGEGVDKNEELSFIYYLKAAEGGKVEAFDIVGESYYIGRGITQNNTEYSRRFQMVFESCRE